MQNKRIVTGWVVSAVGGVMISLGSAAAAEPHSGGSGGTDGLSPEDRCALVKWQATSREARCMTDAHIRGIRLGLSDEEVSELVAACTEKKDQIFENAEDHDLESACRT